MIRERGKDLGKELERWEGQYSRLAGLAWLVGLGLLGWAGLAGVGLRREGLKFTKST